MKADFTGQVPASWTAGTGGKGYIFDLATMWDQYKTTLPLVLSVYPEMGQRLLEGLVNVAKRFGEFPIGYTMDDDVHRFEMQAIGLAHHTLADGLYRNYSIDWTEALELMSDTFNQPVNQLIVFHREYLLKIICSRILMGTASVFAR